MVGGDSGEGNVVSQNTSVFFRLFRLIRLCRISRLCRALPELMTMVKGMLVATRAVSSAMMVLVLLVYVFAIIMNSLNKKEELLLIYFGDMRSSMMTLLLQGVFLDNISVVATLLLDTGSHVSLVAFGFFVLLTATTVMNMLIGVLCEVVCEVAKAEQEEGARRQLKSTLLVELQRHDT